MSVPHLYVDYWRTKAIEREAEIYRLRAELDKLLESDEVGKLIHDHVVSACRGKEKEFETERDRLRAENAELKECADAAITDKFKEIAKVERLRAELEALDRSHKDLAHKLADAGRGIDRLSVKIEALELSNHLMLGRAEQAEEEERRLRAENEKMTNRLRNPELTWAENSRLRAENAELKEALREYGEHKHSCHRHTYPLLEPKRCDCGWSTILAKTAKGE